MTATAQLHHEQQALLQAVLGQRDSKALAACWRAPNPAHEKLARRGLLAYVANGEALAERALSAAYPVLTQLIGIENFAPVARHYWRTCPPERGDMGCWGSTLAAFIETAPQLVDEAYLGDVARVEWALHLAATAPDREPDMASFGLLASGDTTRLTLMLAPGFALVSSPHPVVSIVQAHLTGSPTLAEAGRRLSAGTAECALVWRKGYRPMLRSCDAAGQFVLTGFAAGLALDEVIAGLGDREPAFDLGAWLEQSVQSGLVIGAAALTQHGHRPFSGA